MLHLLYVGESDQKYVVDFQQVTEHVVQLIGDFPVKGNGFILSRIDCNDAWDYTNFRTIYKNVDGGVQFSNDGSVYVAPPVPEPEPEPEPYVPSLEEVKASKKQEIAQMHQSVTSNGVDVNLTMGIQHFSLSNEDMTFLMGKKIEIESGAKEVSYQDSNNRCMILSAEDMQTIIMTAFAFVDRQTTYRNNLYEWIDQCTSSTEVDAITYGIDIPTEYQSESYRRHMLQQERSSDEEDT